MMIYMQNANVLFNFMQAAHPRLKVTLSKLPADLKTLVSKVAETLPHPVLAVPFGVVTRDWNAREVPLEQGQLIRSYSSHVLASAPVIGVYVWLVAPELHGIGLCVSKEVGRRYSIWPCQNWTTSTL